MSHSDALKKMENSISQANMPLETQQAWPKRLFPNNEWILLIVLAAEYLIFSFTGGNFLTSGNVFEITRLSVEIGLLALVMTPIIITGGLDLSQRVLALESWFGAHRAPAQAGPTAASHQGFTSSRYSL